MHNQEKWDRRFLELARHISAWSKDPSTKVGAVIVRPDRTIASVGYNGFPRGMDDDPEIYANRELKLKRVVHAEMNAILNAQEPLKGCTLYVWAPSYGPTCERCAPHVIQTGITRVINQRALGEAIRPGALEAEDMFREAGVEVEIYV